MSTDKFDIELSEDLKRRGELEGYVFEELSLTFCGREYVARRDFYTVKEGIVYAIVGCFLHATGDSLWNVKRDCKKIGKYKQWVEYSPICSTLSHKEVIKALNI